KEGVLSLATLRDAGQKPFDFQIVHHNQGASELLQVPAQSLQWRRLSEGGNLLCSPGITDRLLRIAGGGRDQFEIDAEDRSLRISATAFGDMLSLTISDITALKRREASFRLLFDNNPMPMWVFDIETTSFLSVNDAAVLHYGYSRDKFLGMQIHDIWPRDEWTTHRQALQQIGGSHYAGRNWRHLKADGSEIQVLTYGRRVAFEGRDAFMVAVVDITERR